MLPQCTVTCADSYCFAYILYSVHLTYCIELETVTSSILVLYTISVLILPHLYTCIDGDIYISLNEVCIC